jgi:hypothetical protein
MVGNNSNLMEINYISKFIIIIAWIVYIKYKLIIFFYNFFFYFFIFFN